MIKRALRFFLLMIFLCGILSKAFADGPMRFAFEIHLKSGKKIHVFFEANSADFPMDTSTINSPDSCFSQLKKYYSLKENEPFVFPKAYHSLNYPSDSLFDRGHRKSGFEKYEVAIKSDYIKLYPSEIMNVNYLGWAPFPNTLYCLDSESLTIADIQQLQKKPYFQIIFGDEIMSSACIVCYNPNISIQQIKKMIKKEFNIEPGDGKPFYPFKAKNSDHYYVVREEWKKRKIYLLKLDGLD